MAVTILIGDVRARLKELPSAYFDCVVTSPPYWGLRCYGVEGQLGLERTLGEHIDVLVDVFREVRRVLKHQGTVWLNYGDCYAAAPNGKSAAEYKADGSDDRTFRDKPFSTVGAIYDPEGGRSGGGVRGHNKGNTGGTNAGRIVAAAPFFDPKYATARGQFVAGDRMSRIENGGRIVAGGMLKPKDLCMIPNRLAIALQDDGWWVRSEIIWHKPNPMPESVYDRPTSAHEKIWLLTKSEDYFYNHEAIREAVTGGAKGAHRGKATYGRETLGDAIPAGERRTGPNSRQNVDRVPRARKIKVPGGWDVQPGAHGTINRSGRTEATYVDAEPLSRSGNKQRKLRAQHGGFSGRNSGQGYGIPWEGNTRNARNVWTIAPKAFREAHFATFPPQLAERCILAGVPPTTCHLCGEARTAEDCGGICAGQARDPGRVLDPFGGAGTVGLVAQRLGLDATLIELNPDYAAMAELRIQADAAPKPSDPVRVRERVQPTVT